MTDHRSQNTCFNRILVCHVYSAPGVLSGYVKIRSTRAYLALAKLSLLAFYAKGLEALLLLISNSASVGGTQGAHRNANKGRRRPERVTTSLSLLLRRVRLDSSQLIAQIELRTAGKCEQMPMSSSGGRRDAATVHVATRWHCPLKAVLLPPERAQLCVTSGSCESGTTSQQCPAGRSAGSPARPRERFAPARGHPSARKRSTRRAPVRPHVRDGEAS